MFTAENLKMIGGAEWRHPSTGEVRVYVNELSELYGLHTSHYGSGNISSATLDGQKISNSEAKRILSRLSGAKLWLSADGQMMKKGLDDADARVILNALSAKIEAALAAEPPATEPEPAPAAQSDTAPALTVETIRQWEREAENFSDAVELARHMAPVFDTLYAGVKLTTHGGHLRSDEASAIDSAIDRAFHEAGYVGEDGNAYSLAVQMLARRGLPAFGQLDDPGTVREAVAAAGVDAYTQNEYKHLRACAGNPAKFGAAVAAEAAAQVQAMHVKFPILRALDAYLTANSK